MIPNPAFNRVQFDTFRTDPVIPMTNPPKYKVGDTIYWYCNEDGRVHNAEVQFVNVAKAGNIYIEVNYEVEEESNGVKKTLFIDDYDAMDSEL